MSRAKLGALVLIGGGLMMLIAGVFNVEWLLYRRRDHLYYSMAGGERVRRRILWSIVGALGLAGGLVALIFIPNL